MAKSTSSAPPRKESSGKPSKPYPDFPLFPHATKRWAKKIKGQTHYFGPWDDPDGALQKFLDQKDDLYAGRKPRERRDGLPLVDLVNRFLTVKKRKVDGGELSRRSLNDYDATCGRVIACFGRNRIVEDLRAEDFETLRAEFQKGRGLVSLGNEIQRTRTLFKYAWESDLIPSPVRVGPDFKRPGKKARRRQRNAREPLAYSAAEIHRMTEAATPQLRAMMLLAINTGMGNHDIAQLPLSRLDLDGGWHNFGRPKTGVERRCPLWPETIEALRVVLASRPEPKDESDSDIVFLTRNGRRYVRLVGDGKTWNDAISRECGKLLRSMDFNRTGLNFYSLRRTFRTIADESGDQPAVTFIMGHADSDTDMGATYRQYIADDRLQRVVDHVHGWLYGAANIDENGEK